MTDSPALLRALQQESIRFIVVGGAASTAHGSARLTLDLDVVYDRRPENVERLVTAIRPFRPTLRGAPEGLPFAAQARRRAPEGSRSDRRAGGHPGRAREDRAPLKDLQFNIRAKLGKS
jgi:hypothetical protein